MRCNIGLGMFKDDIRTLSAAIVYLEDAEQSAIDFGSVERRSLSIKSATRRESRTNHLYRSLTFEQAEEIRTLRKTGLKLQDIADIYRTNPGTVSAITRGKIYKNP